MSPPAPPPNSPRPAPEPPFSGGPSYLCPRSGRLLVPWPQSPFDPLLGSEPCDPVGGPCSQAASAARLRCWGESSAPFVPCGLTPVAGGPQVVWPSGGPPRARRRGESGASRGGGRPCSPAGGTAPGPWERGGGSSVSTRGPDFRPRSRRKGLCAATAISL